MQTLPNMSHKRCPWCEKDDLYRNYHDNEWGKPIYDDAILFEFIVLESFQAGLNWHTILKKRKGFEKAFDSFDYRKIAQYTIEKVEHLMQNEQIIRNRLKILAAIHNAQRFMEIQQEFGSFSKFIWKFVDGTPIINNPKTLADVPTTAPISDRIAKELKKRGFKFFGSTSVYAYLQAIGVVNDHLTDCFYK